MNAPRHNERSRAGVILAFLIGGAVLLGVSMFAQHKKSEPPRTAPPLTLIAQDSVVAADTAGNAGLTIRFTTPAKLMLHSGGWMADDLHPHIRFGDITHMAAAADLTHVNADTFAWRLPAMGVGTHLLQLFWADMSHAPAGDTSSTTIRIHP